jgi:hypothetical protein
MSRHMSEAEAIKGFLAQLDAMFSPSLSSSSSILKGSTTGVASQSVISSYVYDWSKVPYVGGAYTSPAFGAR